MKKLVALFVVITIWVLLFPGRACAQDDYTLFRDRAGESSILFRGHKSYDYYMLFNGTPFWTSPEYHPGTVIYSGKFYHDIELNIDAARQELIVRIGKGASNKVLGRAFVKECTIGDCKFLNLQYYLGAMAPDGYWEVLFDGRNKALRRVKKTLEKDINGSLRDKTRYEGPYRYDVYQTFTYSAEYCYLKEDGTIIPIRNRKDALKLVDKPQRNDVRRYIRHLEQSEKLSIDLFFVEIARYLETP